MNPESQSDCGKRRRRPKLPEFLFAVCCLTSVGLKDVKGQHQADYYEESARHFEPKLMKGPDDASEHLFQFTSHER
jgi:hypothetical protein